MAGRQRPLLGFILRLTAYLACLGALLYFWRPPRWLMVLIVVGAVFRVLTLVEAARIARRRENG
jgi:hypothetical protein